MNISLDKIAPPVAFVLVGLIMLVVGATGAIPVGNPQPTISEPAFKIILVVLGSLLILAGPLFVWRELNLAKSADKALEGKTGKSTGKTSADSFFTTSTEERALLEQAKEEIWLVQETGSLAVERGFMALQKLIEKGGRVQILIASEDAHIIELIAFRNQNLDTKRIASRRKEALEKLTALSERTEITYGSLEVRQIAYPLDITAAFIDPKSAQGIGLIRLVGFKNHFPEKRDFLVKADSDPETYEYFLRQLEEMWRLAGSQSAIITHKA